MIALQIFHPEYFHDQGQLISLNERGVQTRRPFAYELPHIYFSSSPGSRGMRVHGEIAKRDAV